MKEKLFATKSSLTFFILRLSLGIVIWPHGYQKITGFSKVMHHLVNDYQLPWLIAFFVVLIEFVTPLLLLVGFASRIMAVLLAVVMIGAIPYHWDNGFFMNWFGNQAGEGFEYHLLAIGIATAIVLEGGGKYSLDRKILNKSQKVLA
ncbi:DoxX family protein [Rapidithrix thailandica]|uniref:DoxX family protein n=1 Tax=Rapidithrix thailandica TaxID=413964 RepID=A0AAW9SM03_9BACT